MAEPGSMSPLMKYIEDMTGGTQLRSKYGDAPWQTFGGKEEAAQVLLNKQGITQGLGKSLVGKLTPEQDVELRATGINPEGNLLQSFNPYGQKPDAGRVNAVVQALNGAQVPEEYKRFMPGFLGYPGAF